jgi:hypothetical protein
VFIGVVLKTPASILSRDGNGAGAPERKLLECFCRERAECPGSNRSVRVAAQHAVFASTQTLVFIPPEWPQAIFGLSALSGGQYLLYKSFNILPEFTGRDTGQRISGQTYMTLNRCDLCNSGQFHCSYNEGGSSKSRASNNS